MPAPPWEALRGRYPDAWVSHLSQRIDGGSAVNETPETIAALYVDAEVRRGIDDLVVAAASLLDELHEGGWLERDISRTCPICEFSVPPGHAGGVCPNPDPPSHAFTDDGDPGPIETRYYHGSGIPRRYVSWMLALHGMNTRGAWQEDFNWLVSTTYGRMVPVAIYKYGIIRPGVLSRRRQRSLMRGLIERIHKLSRAASPIVADPRPDVIAHSFGTFLLGHALHLDPTLEVRRIITLGCILRPDFDWGTLVARGQVEAVLNHYGTKDFWAARAHGTIPDAGPAGRRGFDFYPAGWPPEVRDPPDRVLFNVPADGFGHSRFFKNDDGPPSTMARQFSELWERFLTTRDIPDVEARIPNEPFPTERWRQSRWPRRALTGWFRKAPNTAEEV